jgi:hypothetical protein
MGQGWGLPLGAPPAERLAKAVERFLASRTTANREAMAAALADYRRGTTVHVEIYTSPAIPPGTFASLNLTAIQEAYDMGRRRR